MENKFEQISIKPGFMKHNGGVLFRTISENEYEFKSVIYFFCIIFFIIFLLTIIL